ncbi:LAQU0S42e00100g1_1 [Lachancea quebecensis]|uniref:LAQU0S42e00100g1_1 n=1 Tax=Lachancea quebecensis TaxID=1654605 RepID=A0A0P1L0D3_9SACH|nr:LAQU0S42e00100g1_1 [Lachancea quebecensis]
MKYAQPIPLPKYLHNSLLSWMRSEMIRMRFIQILIVFGAMSAVYTYIKKKSSFLTLPSAYILFHMPGYLKYSWQRTVSKHIRDIRDKVKKENPVVSVEQWDTLSRHVTECINRSKHWPGNHHPYDGQQCHEYFKQAVVYLYNNQQQGNEELTRSPGEEQNLQDELVAYKESLKSWWEDFSTTTYDDSYVEA